MFKLVATIYLLMNGVPVGDPLTMNHRTKFETLEACVSYKDGDDGAKDLAKLNAKVVSNLPEGATHTVTVSCEKGEDDGSI